MTKPQPPHDLMEAIRLSVKGTDKTEYVRFNPKSGEWYHSTQNPNCSAIAEDEWYMIHHGGVFHALSKSANSRTNSFDSCSVVGCCRYAHHSPACPGSDCNCPQCNEQQQHDPATCGCKYLGSDMWTCGHVDNDICTE